ncbi:MAG: hypothetical protein AAF496_00115 [Pseudomonadota bacterium]
MARFTLNANYTLKDLGCEVLRAARGRANGSRGQEEEAEKKIRDMIAQLEGRDVQFVYDTERLINVIIPDIRDKVSEDDEEESWCNDFAYEAMGGIVVFGCGS